MGPVCGPGTYAEVRITTSGKDAAEIIRKSICVGERPGSRSSVTATSKGEALTFEVRASDIGALRATLNSLLREVKIANDML